VNPADLFAALGAAPRLDGALCKGKHALFGGEDPADVEAAIELCSRCPCARPCRTWADSLPPNSLDGVVAGERYTWVQQAMGRPRKSAL
jgi:hypothetical protein